MKKSKASRLAAFLAAAGVVSAFPVLARPVPTLSPDLRARVDSAAREVLAATGVPSASLAIVKEGRIAYIEAYGNACLEPRTPARPAMRYSVGSISKQFTAAAILMLAEQNQLSLDDPVSRFEPSLTRASEITIRQLLSHTSGYQDYWPQDYVPPSMMRETTAAGILDRWAKMPLDFDPGTRYQYSNTNYVLAGLIVEKASGTPFLDFLRARVFVPLGMASVTDVDRGRLGRGDATGYLRYALGPPRVAPKEGKGWLFAAGELAMTAEDLARWNISVLDRSLMTRASYEEMETDVRLKNGLGTRYGLGVGVTSESGHRAIEHGGEVSGFTASNWVFPDDRAAITVLTNQDSTDAAAAIVRKILPLLFAKEGPADASEARARRVFEALQRGRIDRSLLTANANSYFTEQALRDFASSLGPLGKPSSFRETSRRDRGGMTFRGFEVKYLRMTLAIWERDMPDGRIEQFQVLARD